MKKLKKIREIHNLTQARTAKLLGYSHQLIISNFEREVYPIPKPASILINLLYQNKITIADLEEAQR